MRGPEVRLRWGLVIHGGVDVLTPKALTSELEQSYRGALQEALEAGRSALVAGGSAVEAVVEAVRVMEDSPLFNAGRGCNLDSQGRPSLDASIMRGWDQGVGAVAGVRTVRHPIELAREVMEHCPHVFLIGDGAEGFARERGLREEPEEWFVTPRRVEYLERARRREAEGDDRPNVMGRGAGLRPVDVPGPGFDGEAGMPPSEKSGTVGAVALDPSGRVAAGTSTGGMANKKWGRVGDSPVPGAGTWASPRCGVSCTGWGEYFIRNAVAHDVDARMAHGGRTLGEAAREVVLGTLQDQMPGLGGLVALDAAGHVEMVFSTGGMYRGWIDHDGRTEVAIY